MKLSKTGGEDGVNSEANESGEESNSGCAEPAEQEAVSLEELEVETAQWGEQTLDEFVESVAEIAGRPVEFGAADTQRVDEIAFAVAELQAGVEALVGEAMEWEVEFEYDLRENVENTVRER